MSESELHELIEKVKAVVIEAAEFIAKEYGKVAKSDIEVKARNSLVSYVDKQAEVLLVEKLGAMLPTATFLTEEDTVENDRSDLVWIIDPLDGTTNFLQRIPFFSVSVALEAKGEMILGVVHGVMQQETFYAWKGGGSYLNGVKLEVTSPGGLADTILATGFPYVARSKEYLETFIELMQQVQAIRRLGSAALDLAFVAAGRFDAYFESNLNAWDIAAGALIVKEAGGTVSGFYEDDGWKEGKSIIASAPSVHGLLQEVIVRHKP